MPCGKKKKEGLDESKKKILAALSKMKEPANTKMLSEATKLPTSTISGKLRSLKTKGFIESPARCKYAITDTGKKELGK